MFAAQLVADPFRDTAGADLLTALRGKDVVIALVESYGRTAVDQPEVAAVLAAGERRLAAAGFAARSGYLTSPTAGGGSWLAQSTLLSGLWVDNQHRYDALMHSDRLTLNRAFGRAGWRTVGVMPGVILDWPEGAFFGYDRIYAAADLGYRGPNFSFATMPDQYTLSAFERLERAAADRPPLMAVIPLISSHAPWNPVPTLVDWGEVGDGSGFPAGDGAGDPADVVLHRDAARVRADYARAVGYSLTTVVSYLETYGDDDLVVVLLGDHQPAPVVTGDGREPGRAGHDPGPRPGRARPGRRLGLVGRPAAGRRRPGLADGRLPGPVPDRLQPVAAVTPGPAVPPGAPRCCRRGRRSRRTSCTWRGPGPARPPSPPASCAGSR